MDTQTVNDKERLQARRSINIGILKKEPQLIEFGLLALGNEQYIDDVVSKLKKQQKDFIQKNIDRISERLS